MKNTERRRHHAVGLLMEKSALHALPQQVIASVRRDTRLIRSRRQCGEITIGGTTVGLDGMGILGAMARGAGAGR